MKERNKNFIEPSEKNPTKIVRDFFMQSGEKYVGRIVRINCLKKVQRFYLTSGTTNGKIPMRIFPSLLLAVRLHKVQIQLNLIKFGGKANKKRTC